MAPGAMRDTDADWRKLGATQPYWGVLTHPEFRTENLTAEGLEAFYATGRQYVDDILSRFERLFGDRPAGSALDFGCGAGRLTEAMAERTAQATGYDISPGMLDEARKRGGGALYVSELPAGPFEWVNTYIVLQHIPPVRGLALIEALLARVAPAGFASLHVTTWREPHLLPATGPRWRRIARGLRGAAPVGQISMYDYELSAVTRAFDRAGFGELGLVPTDHGGHHGVIVLGRRAAP